MLRWADEQSNTYDSLAHRTYFRARRLTFSMNVINKNTQPIHNNAKHITRTNSTRSPINTLHHFGEHTY
jgi:hypothetical protein